MSPTLNGCEDLATACCAACPSTLLYGTEGRSCRSACGRSGTASSWPLERRCSCSRRARAHWAAREHLCAGSLACWHCCCLPAPGQGGQGLRDVLMPHSQNTPLHCGLCAGRAGLSCACLRLQELAQRALVSYLRSVFLQPDRAVFDVTRLPAAEYALSLGLSTAPKLRFLRKAGRKVQEVRANLWV